MRSSFSIKTARACLAAVLLAAAGSAFNAPAAVALNGQIAIRPLTPQEIKDYSLTGTQGASGLATIGIGQPAYLEALVNTAIAPSDIVAVTWSLTNRPVGSAAALMASPLGTNVPTYKMADRVSLRVAGRTLLRPDVAGQYTVVVRIETTTSGSTNVTQVINAGTYMGVNTCALCHSGGIAAENKVVPWSQTGHATFFTRAIDGQASDHYGKNCISCHTVGYDANTNAVNAGFDDVALQLGWTFPSVLTNGNWNSLPASLKNLSNIQCENCHGPGSEHAFSLGDTTKISTSFAAGDCGQCHDSKPNHVRNIEWNNSGHAIAPRSPSGPNRPTCVRCHTAGGFTDYVMHLGSTQTYTTNTVYEAITCAACHEPHDATNPHQLRTGKTITLDCGTSVTNAGTGGVCMNCHQSRTGSVTNSLVKYPLMQPTWAGGSSFGPHDNPAADMLMGVNGYTYGKEIPSAAHRSITDTCAACHMQTVTSTDPGFTKVGGHTFKMSYQVVSGGTTNTVDKVDACVQCHGAITSFDMVRQDYNGDGVIEGVQTEVQQLLNKLNTLLPNSTWRADGMYVADGLVNSVSVKTNWQAKFLQGAWNYQLVNNDLSKGIHNAPYAVGLLKASIADLSGDGNEDGLPDSWQIQYFGSANNPNAAPNATPAGDGVPNWLKYGLGLNPWTPGIVLPDGVIWANAGQVGGTNMTDKIQIFTAAEVVYNTEVGKTYQLQAISSLDGGWKNIGDPVVATTNAAVSFVTPTRTSQQQFYRVQITP